LARVEQHGALGGDVDIALGFQIGRLGNDVLPGATSTPLLHVSLENRVT
jgi:hypothetical protein